MAARFKNNLLLRKYTVKQCKIKGSLKGDIDLWFLKYLSLKIVIETKKKLENEI